MGDISDAPSTNISPLQAQLERELTLPEAQDAPVAPVETPVADPVPVEATPVQETPPVDPQAPPVAQDTPPAAESEDEEDPDELPPPDKSRQIRLKGPDFQYAKLVKSGLTPAEAFAKAYGTTPAAPAATTDVPAAPATPEPTAAEKELAIVQAEIAKYGDEDGGALVDKRYNELQLKQSELLTDIKLEKRFAQARAAEIAELEREQQAEAQGKTFDQAWDASVAKVVERYGDEGKETGKLGAAIADHILKITEDTSHPFHAVAKAGNLLPQHVMHEVADTLGLAQTSPSRPVAPPATPKVPAMLPAPGSARQTPVVPANEAQRRAKLSTDLSNARTPDEKARILAADLGGEEGVTDGRFAMA